MSLIFDNKRLEPVLDHVFGAFFAEEGHHFGPLLADSLDDSLQNDEIFLERPLSADLVGVEVVEPALSAVFGGDEDLALADGEDAFGDLVPLSLEGVAG